MPFLALCFITSLVLTFIVIRSAARHAGFSADHDLSGPQKFHTRPVPRVGGVAVFIAALAGAALARYLGDIDAGSIWLLLVASLPTFVFGLAEDITKNVSPRRRLFFTALSAALAVMLLGAVVSRTGIPFLDHVVAVAPFAIALTVFAVTGIANAINIIDGFNGLASMCAMMILMAIGYVAFQVGDSLVLTLSIIGVGAVLGFFVWNFPAGLIFLGDGGAYFLGFLIAELSVLLLHRNPGVSPMFPLLLCAYPIFETIFTMYRRRVLRGVATGEPDGIHLHTLIHRRLIRLNVDPTGDRRRMNRNSMTSPYLWMLCLLTVVPAVIWWQDTMTLRFFVLAFMLCYVALYWRIVRFRTPKWLVFRR